MEGTFLGYHSNNFFILQEAVEINAVADEVDASIRTCMVVGCCGKRLDEILQVHFDSSCLETTTMREQTVWIWFCWGK